jgi:hypothetical protein
MPFSQVLAQALVEHGLLDSIAAGMVAARDRLELYIGRGNGTYAVAAALVIIVLLLLRRRR